MKIIISESQNKNLKLSLKQIIKSVGIESAFQTVGGPDILLQILDINSVMDFLHLFDDLEQVQSVEYEDLILFRYKPEHNLMIYDRKNHYVHISYDDIWSVLEDKFGLNFFESQELLNKWLFEVYNLRGVTIGLHRASSLKGWMRSTI